MERGSLPARAQGLPGRIQGASVVAGAGTESTSWEARHRDEGGPMRRHWWIALALPVILSAPGIRAYAGEEGGPEDRRAALKQKLENVMREMKEASERGEKERAAELEKAVHEIRGALEAEGREREGGVPADERAALK